MNKKNESEQPQKQVLITTEIKDMFAAMAISAQREDRPQLRTFFLILSAIEEKGGLDTLAETLKPQLVQFLQNLNQDSLQQWPEAIEI